MDKNIIRKTKSACVGIGILQKGNPLPLVISGSGFLIDSEGYVLTATHVIDQLVIKKNELRKQGLDVGIVASKVGVHNGHPEIKSRGLIERRRIIIKPSEKFPAPANFDVVLCRMIGKENHPSHLSIKKPAKIELDEKIAVCGYPGGMATFNFKDFEAGLRLSPQIQRGRVSGVMPMDDVTMPTGIQTDIIGTGGSSGSPIITSNDGEVIGIAQRVLSSPVTTLDQKGLMGLSQSGLIFGVSNYGFYAPVKTMLKDMKNELDENGRLKPEFEEKYKKNPSKFIGFNVKKPEETVDSTKEQFES